MKTTPLLHRLKTFIGVDRTARRGAAHVLVAAMLVVFIIAAALTVDVSYMQLVRTELRTATDAAAKAGAEALSRTQDEDFARSEAVRYAALNHVGGAPLMISPSDVHLGQVSPGSDGSWAFTEGTNRPNAVRVDGRVGHTATTDAKPLFFGPALGVPDFSTSHQSTAARQEVDICFALDRSGSMLFDLTGEESSYTKPNPNLSTWTQWGTSWQYRLSPPHPTGSRWAVLRDAIELFLDEASLYRLRPRTSLVTWGSDYVMPIPPSTPFTSSSTDVDLPWQSEFDWDINRDQILAAMDARGTQPMMGATNMAAGLDRAVTVMTGPRTLPLRSRIIILLSDGQWNEGQDPVLEAMEAYAADITVHTISMLSVDTWTLQEIARVTGGEFYAAISESQLREAFRKIARSLPVVFTE